MNDKPGLGADEELPSSLPPEFFDDWLAATCEEMAGALGSALLPSSDAGAEGVRSRAVTIRRYDALAALRSAVVADVKSFADRFGGISFSHEMDRALCPLLAQDAMRWDRDVGLRLSVFFQYLGVRIDAAWSFVVVPDTPEHEEAWRQYLAERALEEATAADFYDRPEQYEEPLRSPISPIYLPALDAALDAAAGIGPELLPMSVLADLGSFARELHGDELADVVSHMPGGVFGVGGSANPGIGDWVDNAPGSYGKEPPLGARVEVEFPGDPDPYHGLSVRPSKLWVALDDHDFIATACENTIARWRVVEAPTTESVAAAKAWHQLGLKPAGNQDCPLAAPSIAGIADHASQIREAVARGAITAEIKPLCDGREMTGAAAAIIEGHVAAGMLRWVDGVLTVTAPWERANLPDPNELPDTQAISRQLDEGQRRAAPFRGGRLTRAEFAAMPHDGARWEFINDGGIVYDEPEER